MPDTDFADMERMSPWLLRIELNREMLTDKGLNMSRIADTITSEFGDEMSVIFTDDNAPKHILRVSLASSWLWHCNLSAHLHRRNLVAQHANQWFDAKGSCCGICCWRRSNVLTAVYSLM